MGNFFLLILLSCFGVCGAFAQTSCEYPASLDKEDFKILSDEQVFVLGEFGSLTTFFKNPSTSTMVNAVDFIECEGYMPNRAKIESIRVVEVTGLPKGLSWSCDVETNSWKGGEIGCFFIEGVAEEVGTFPLVIEVEGVGGLFGVTRTYPCFFRGFEVVVK